MLYEVITGTDGFYSFEFSTTESDQTGTWRAVVTAAASNFEIPLKIEAVVPNRITVNIDSSLQTITRTDMDIPVAVDAKFLFGVAYMALVGRHLLPKRKAGTLTEAYQVKEYITEVEILEDSPVAGETIAGSGLEQEFELRVRAILRGNEKIPLPRRNRKIKAGDILFLEGNPESILKLRKKSYNFV